MLLTNNMSLIYSMMICALAVSFLSGEKNLRYPTISIVVFEMLFFSIVRYEMLCNFFCIFSSMLIVALAQVLIFFLVISILFCTSLMSHENPSMGSPSFNVLIVVRSEAILLHQRFWVNVVD